MLALLAMLLVQSGQTLPADGREFIADVKIVGNQNVPAAKIMTCIHTRPGSEYNPATLYDDVTRLSESRMFKSVRAREERTNNGLVLTFHVVEYPNLVRDVVYKNARGIPRRELDSLSRVHKGMPLDPTTNKNACFEIQDYLKKKGHYWAQVTLEEGSEAKDQCVIFNISAGPIVRLRSLKFTGNDTLADSSTLRKEFETTEGEIFQLASIDYNLIRLEVYYQFDGHRDVKISRELIFSPDQSRVDVTYHIVEGRRYRVKDWVVDGAESPLGKEAVSVIKLKPNEFYSEYAAAADVRAIADFYGWRGYFVKVQKEIFNFPGESGFVRVQYEVKEKTKVPDKIGRIYVVGNDVTKESVVLQALGLYPGQTLRYPELRTAQRNLERLKIFEEATVKVVNPDAEGEFKDMLVEVRETRTGSLLLGAGVNSRCVPTYLQFVLEERNFDALRWPSSWADIADGRAFRGAGQKVRLGFRFDAHGGRIVAEPLPGNLPAAFGSCLVSWARRLADLD